MCLYCPYCFLVLCLLEKSGKRQNEMTLEDMYNKHYDFDEDDDDSDWDPSESNTEVLKWFCVNCTMVNYDDVIHCDVCFCLNHVKHT